MKDLILIGQIDKELSEFEQAIKQIGVQATWLLGEQLLKGKEKIIELTGDRRAPGFTDWSKRKFGWNKSTVSRLIKSYTEKIENADIIWGNVKKVALTQPISLPGGNYQVLYADPPWQYDFSETESRAIESKYPTLSIEQIKSLNIQTDDNAILFLWGTAPKLKEGLEVMEAWGFEYITHAVWDKEIMGMGYWFRGRHELLLVGTKGNVSPPSPELREPSVLKERRGRHSAKPKKIYGWLEKWFPNASFVELFAREKREGWISWGDEIK